MGARNAGRKRCLAIFLVVGKSFLRRGVALEISASYQLPKLEFLRIAKAAGARFSFGSNGRYPKMGQLQYCLEMAQTLKLARADVFGPDHAAMRFDNLFRDRKTQARMVAELLFRTF